MPRRMARGRKGGKPRYSWHGFYMNNPISPSDILTDVFVLYDPIDSDHQEEVVLQRTIIDMAVVNSDTVASGNIGFGLYLANRNSAAAMSSDIDPLGVTAFDVEANWQLWHHSVNLQKKVAGQSEIWQRFEFNSKAKRKIQDTQFLVMVIRGDTVDRWKYQFTARCLLLEGRF